MMSICPWCGGPSTSVVGGYDHHNWCPQKYNTVSWPMTAPNISAQPMGSPIPADGALHRCYCGTPIWFEQPPAPMPGNFSYTSSPPCWRETDGSPHRCPKEGHDG